MELAFSWYEKQRKGLGHEFLNCIEICLNNILSFPEMYETCYSRFRRCVVPKFPFSIFYTIETYQIVVHAVFNNRQDPQKRP